ncbi:MAG: pyridoxal-phosphate-dependent aminotransferase family protein [Tepidiformaceae bacterium]
MSSTPRLNPPSRLLMGPGPSGAHPSVLQAMTSPILGHLDPEFIRIMDECRDMLRRAMLTENDFTLATPGTGTSGMEAAVMNLVEPGDRVISGVCGYFGGRMVEMAQRAGGIVTRVDVPWGTAIDPEAIALAVEQAGPVKVVTIVHAETSTGILQPIDEISRIAHDAGALLVVDCVTSLGGVPVTVDEWGADAVYSGTQKCLSAPPGVSPITLSSAALRAVRSRETPCNTWYLDLGLLDSYWGERHSYHHTAPISMIYALHAALQVVLDEGLENRWARHERNGRALQAGLEAMGLSLHAEERHRLPVLTTVAIPEGVDDLAVRGALLANNSIEIGGGLGDLRGKVWRVGLMGESSTPGNVLFFLTSFGRLLRENGYKADLRAGLEEATRRLER